MTDKIFGIDLGTTNSCIAVLDNGVPRVIPIDGTGIVPSAVSLDGNQILVGRKALNRALAFPEQSVRSIKRLMGTDQKVQLGDKTCTPEEISAMILDYLKQEAKNLEGLEVERAVITVPAYFSEAQRRATMKAGELAGLKVERIINEPTSAALFYDLLKVSDTEIPSKGSQYTLVYDLGGGTLDVSVLRMSEIAEVLASTGDTHLGGDDFDASLTKVLLDQIKQSDQIDLSDYRPAMARLTAAAEKAKIELSSRGITLIEETMIPCPKRKTVSLSREISRSEFEQHTANLVDKSLEFVHKALEEAGLVSNNIDRVLLVGGMTRMPIVAEKLGKIFGQAQVPTVDPDLSVAKGAAIQGGIITGENAAQILVDVTAHTLSLMVADHYTNKTYCSPIIPRNTPIPATRSQLYSTAVANQEIGMLVVFQGESIEVSENECIGSAPLHLAKVRSRTPIEVEYSYDVNGMIHVVAEQKGYNRKLELDLDSRNPSKKGFSPGTGEFFNLDEFFDSSNGDDDYDDSDDADNDDDKSIDQPTTDRVNFVLKRANTILSTMEDGQAKDEMSDLVNRYQIALNEESADLDDLEDKLLSLIE
jgi:molecular chaperone DnaK